MYGEPTRGRARGAAQNDRISELRAQGKSEDEIAAVQREIARGRSAHLPPIVTRPSTLSSKQGTSGTPVNLKANYIKFTAPDHFQFYQYHVDYEPPVDTVRLRRFFFNSAFPDFANSNVFLFDGSSTLFGRSIETPLVAKVPGQADEQNVLIKAIVNSDPITLEHNAAVRVMNVIFRQGMKALNLQLVKRNLYDAGAAIRVPELKLQLWPGYITSIRLHESNILACVEISHKVMRDETVYRFLGDLKRRSRSGDWQSDFEREIIGKVVLTDYNNKTYRISGVDFSRTPRSKFELKGVETTILSYYASKYRIQIQDHDQPLLICNPSDRALRGGRQEEIALVPELCRMTGLPDDIFNNFNLMKIYRGHTQLDPQTRVRNLVNFVQRLKNNAEANAKLQFNGSQLEDQLVSFKGRKLPNEQMVFANGKTFPVDQYGDFTKAFVQKNAMYKSETLTRWVIICPSKFKSDIEKFLKDLRQVGGGMNYSFDAPRFEWIDDRPNEYAKAIEKYHKMDPKLIFVVLQNNNADRYSVIKKTTCFHESTIPTQVVLLKNLSKGLSVATKILIQMNCKIGGAPWMVSFPMTGVMTCGFDVSHDPRNKKHSYGAFVASMDLRECVKYYSSCMKHETGVEISGAISNHVCNAVEQYRNTHRALPSKIFFYRDGVGEGDVENVMESEVRPINEKLKKIYGSENAVKMTYVIVNKRLNTRIFLDNNNGNVANPGIGTVVDNTITLPERYDFYLVSQSVRVGTVSPTSYNVIHDTVGLPADRLQLITYKNCHLYYNWSGVLKVPAVVQYAHKLSVLCSEFLRDVPHRGFSDKGLLWFL